MENCLNSYWSSHQLDTLAVSALQHLEGMGYQSETCRLYQRTWRSFLKFADENSSVEHSFPDLVGHFCRKRGIQEDQVQAQLTSLQRHIRAAMRVLSDFAVNGSYRIRRSSIKSIHLSPKMEPLLSDYEQFSIQHLGIGCRTMRVRRQNIRDFLLYMEEPCGINSIENISPMMLSEYVISCAHFKSTTLALKFANIRSFLRYLCMQGTISEVLIDQIPKMHIHQDSSIPSIWPADSLETLLGAVDRTSSCGKRDYAILLLAARLGLRVGDIRRLSLDAFCWEEARINISQAKTGIAFSLPLTEEIGVAIIDYLRNGRPKSSHREVFLRANAPFRPMDHNNNLHYLVKKYRSVAGIPQPSQPYRGLHSLRHSLASQLLQSDVNLETISGVMGHVSQETTRRYVKIDIEMLRSAALDPEEVSHA